MISKISDKNFALKILYFSPCYPTKVIVYIKNRLREFNPSKIAGESLKSPMIQPSEVSTRDKDRDAQILNLFQYEHLTFKEIGQKFDITGEAVSYIIQKNKHLLKIDAEFEKAKRINKLQRIFENCGDKLSPKKDVLNVITELRHEIEGEGNKTLVQNSFNFGEFDAGEVREIIASLRAGTLQKRAA